MTRNLAGIAAVWVVLIGAALWMATVSHDLGPQPATTAPTIWHGPIR